MVLEPQGARVGEHALVPDQPVERGLHVGAARSQVLERVELRRVVAPLLKRSLLGAWLLVFIPATRELSAAIFLYGTNTKVASVMIFDMSEEGNFEYLAALALILGRRLTNDVYPSGLTHALTSASLRAGIGSPEPLSFAFRDWLRRAMQLEPRVSFPTALEAGAALDEAIGEENEALERDALHVFLARCLALDMENAPDPSSVPAVTELDPEKLDLVTDDVSAEVDLGVDSGAIYSVVPAAMLRKIGVEPRKVETFSLANGGTVRRAIGDVYYEIDRSAGAA